MTEKQELIKLHHSSDEKIKVTVNEDHLQAYLDSGYVRTDESQKAEESK